MPVGGMDGAFELFLRVVVKKKRKNALRGIHVGAPERSRIDLRAVEVVRHEEAAVAGKSLKHGLPARHDFILVAGAVVKHECGLRGMDECENSPLNIVVRERFVGNDRKVAKTFSLHPRLLSSTKRLSRRTSDKFKSPSPVG